MCQWDGVCCPSGNVTNGERMAVRVLINGPELQTETLISHLSQEGVECQKSDRSIKKSFWQALRSDVVQRSPFVAWDLRKSFIIFAWAKLLGCRTVRYWLGTDVLLSLQDVQIRQRTKRLQALTDANVTVAPHLVEELATIGIEAECMYSPQDSLAPASIPPFPAAFAVLYYSLPDRREFYMLPELLQVAQRLPEVRFDVVGDSGDGVEVPQNVRFLGFVDDMDTAYADTSLLLRLVPHDGWPRMVLEAFARARPVIYNRRFPHCVHANGVDGVVSTIRSLLADLRPNDEGHEFVRDNYSNNGQALAMKRFYEELSGRRR